MNIVYYLIEGKSTHISDKAILNILYYLIEGKSTHISDTSDKAI